MTADYGRLDRGKGRAEALRSTQLEMLRSPARRHPYYWASFISIGAWGPIELTSEGEEENAQAGPKQRCPTSCSDIWRRNKGTEPLAAASASAFACERIGKTAAFPAPVDAMSSPTRTRGESPGLHRPRARITDNTDSCWTL